MRRVAVCWSSRWRVFLLSLLGMPPLVGFAAKFQIFSVLFDAGQIYAQDPASRPQLLPCTPCS